MGEGRGRGKQELIVLYVFVEGEYFCFGGRVVGLKEGEAEVVLVDRYIEHQANAAHSNK